MVDIEKMFASGEREWCKRARCHQPGAPSTEFFFDKKKIEEAKAFCEACPVRMQCLEYALTMVDAGHSARIVSELGVWGGASGADRVRIRNERKES